MFSIQNMLERRKEREREKEGSLFLLNLMPSSSLVVWTHVNLVSLVSFHLALSPSSPC